MFSVTLESRVCARRRHLRDLVKVSNLSSLLQALDTIQRTELLTGDLQVIFYVKYLQFIKLMQYLSKDL